MVELRLSERYVDLIEEGVDVTIRVGEPTAAGSEHYVKTRINQRSTATG
jgi:DNA-binding transcriptional LysR family regulator